ncbi:2-amino-4-hydroxy-6-hydroxymethyldihydropteridine diphosphokinase [Permianibacter sp. IMCC34836]|uniref:2-amino-4-hydroxy-6- hydroxymethyldihydropteridine diphosphokinase n=1 Tax=Permianibacter fluminis TaxID=2738515 RepID=UPI0015562F38|nr:2-amino-4-hydroxy-6-hydroxymethyldihydropteridine diphosphokinase [Permianibacter fluminis]NQD38998.1 2-amino-4-hydroxy-6-hydroxymethyldihydropteridine diphosphokinase [Permianibacter fluminis]
MTGGANSVRAYIGLGSNLAEPIRQVQQAIDALAILPLSRLVARSSLYRSAALTRPDCETAQPDYINAVAAIETSLAPQALLAALLQIEQRQGRTRGAERWTARTLDLDLLLYGNLQLQTPALTVPHYALTERAFVVLPLHEIAADLQLPDGRRVSELAATYTGSGVQRLSG